MGPGTHIEERILKNIRPTTHIDQVAMEHDIDYLSDNEPIISDYKAILKTIVAHNLYEQVQGAIMRYGLTLRSIYDGILHLLPLPNIAHINTPSNKYKQLQQLARNLKPLS